MESREARNRPQRYVMQVGRGAMQVHRRGSGMRSRLLRGGEGGGGGRRGKWGLAEQSRDTTTTTTTG